MKIPVCQRTRGVCLDFENPNLFDPYSLAEFPKCPMNIRLPFSLGHDIYILVNQAPSYILLKNNLDFDLLEHRPKNKGGFIVTQILSVCEVS